MINDNWKEGLRNASINNIWLILTLFIVAATVRILMAAFLIPIDWNWDSYHHWQIAYYTLNIGLKYGRMWDLMGVEYYWPPLPLLTESFLIWLFGTSIWNMRIFNMIIGSSSAVLAYLVGKTRNKNTGIVSGLFVALFPILVFHDILGLSETMMVFFSLLGLLAICKGHDFYSGLAFGLASICHFAAYPLIFLLIIYEIVSKRAGVYLIPALAGYGTVMIPYVFTLHVHTGDWLYMFKIIGFPTYGWDVRFLYILLGISMIVPALAGLGYNIKTKQLKPVLLFSFGDLLFYGLLLTIRTPPLYGAERYYMLLSVFVSLVLSYYMGSLLLMFKRIRLPHTIFSVVIICILLSVVVAPRFVSYQGAVRSFWEVADYLGPRYNGGTIISELPPITYSLIHYWNIDGRNILGAHYSPLDPDGRLAWLRKHNVTWVIYSTADFDFTNRVFRELSDGSDHPPFFLAKSFGEVRIYEVRL